MPLQLKVLFSRQRSACPNTELRVPKRGLKGWFLSPGFHRTDVSHILLSHFFPYIKT